MTQRLMASGVKPMTGPLRLSDGSVSAPAAAFNNALTTGWYKTTTGIGFSVGGVQVAELVSGGFKTGALPIGAIVPFSGKTAPSLFVLPYGQTLDRTTYADLWAFAQVEIAAGNTFYNNGNGSTTFGIGDMRGRVPAGWDSMGGSSANRLTAADDGLNGDTMGATGGGETQTLVTANLPAYTPSGSVAVTTIGIKTRGGSFAGSTDDPNSVLEGKSSLTLSNPNNGPIVQPTASFTGSAQGGTSTAFGIVQPTIICNYLLFAGV